MLAMQFMVDLDLDLLHKIALEAASILESEGLDSLTVAEINRCKSRLSRRQGLGRRECMLPFPGVEPSALCLIKVHSLHGQHRMQRPLPDVTAMMRQPGLAAT
jgi:hypothetical protein